MTRERTTNATSGSSNESKAIKIALADDHAIFRDGLRRLLALEPDIKIVGEAKDGTEVLPILEEHEPDILLLDLRMPETDGLEVLQRIQTNKLKTKIIVLTASEDENEYVQAIKCGAPGIVRKQTATELLIESIRKVCEGETWLDSQTTAAVLRVFASPSEPSSRESEKPAITDRENEIIGCIGQGFKNKEIGEKLFINEQTVKNHLRNIFQKLGVSDRCELALYALNNNRRPRQ